MEFHFVLIDHLLEKLIRYNNCLVKIYIFWPLFVRPISWIASINYFKQFENNLK